MLLHPDALWLLASVPVLVLLWRRTPAGITPRGWWVVALLRTAAIVLLVLALARPADVRRGVGGNRRLVVLADASLSVAPGERARVRQLVADAVATARAKSVGATGIAFARKAHVGLEAPDAWDRLERADFRRERDGTDIGAALDAGIAAVQPGEGAAAVLLTDGAHTTGDLQLAIGRAARAGLAVHPLALAARQPGGAGIEKLEAPDRAYPGDTVELVVTVRSAEAGVGVLTVYRDVADARALQLPMAVLYRQRVKLAAGQSTFRVTSPEKEAALVRFRARIEPELMADDLPEDDERLALTDVRPVPRALVVARTTILADTLRTQGILTDLQQPSDVPADAAARARHAPLDVPSLARYAAVIVDDVPAKQLSPAFLAAVEVATRERGTGFAMVGGTGSFEQGAYQNTPVEKLLPVEMLKTTPSSGSAVVVLVDQSWSMAGWPLHEGKRACKELLRLLDGREVAMLSFAARAAEVFPLQPLGGELTSLEQSIERIRPRGGTDLLPPLREAERILVESGAANRYVLLLTDGEPEQTAGLLDQAASMRRAGIQVSTVRISKLPETALLAQLAQHGGGRYHQAADFEQLKKLFEEEANTIAEGVSVTRGTFGVQLVKASLMVRGFVPDSFPLFNGLSITRVKPRAEALLAVAPRLKLTASQGALPLLASWRYGLGTSAAFMSDSGARWTRSWRTWRERPRFWAQFIKGLMPREPSAFAVRAHLRDGVGQVAVDAIRADGSTIDFLALTARIAGPEGADRDLPLVQSEAGRYLGRFDASARGFYRIAVARRDTGASVGHTALAQSDAAELEARGTDEATLAAIASQTGGRRISPADLAGIVDGIPVVAPATQHDAWPGLALVAMLLFMLEVGLRRSGAFVADPAGAGAAGQQTLEAAERAQLSARQLEDAGDTRAAAAQFLEAYGHFLRAGASERAAQAWARYRRADERSREP